jgi:TorA maturation chaperone TorD
MTYITQNEIVNIAYDMHEARVFLLKCLLEWILTFLASV